MLVPQLSKTLSIASLIVLLGIPSTASDPVGVYAIVDRVVTTPSEGDPKTIQVWGVFALADANDRNNYLAAQRGYLFFTINARNERATRAEWNDLESVAGTKTPIGFGLRYGQNLRIRPASEAPANPDLHPLGVGVMKNLDKARASHVQADLLRVHGETKKSH